MDNSGFEKLNADSVLPPMEKGIGKPVDALKSDDLAALMEEIAKQGQ